MTLFRLTIIFFCIINQFGGLVACDENTKILDDDTLKKGNLSDLLCLNQLKWMGAISIKKRSDFIELLLKKYEIDRKSIKTIEEINTPQGISRYRYKLEGKRELVVIVDFEHKLQGPIHNYFVAVIPYYDKSNKLVTAQKFSECLYDYTKRHMLEYENGKYSFVEINRFKEVWAKQRVIVGVSLTKNQPLVFKTYYGDKRYVHLHKIDGQAKSIRISIGLHVRTLLVKNDDDKYIVEYKNVGEGRKKLRVYRIPVGVNPDVVANKIRKKS